MPNVTNHKDREHALLSASSSKQWLICPPSARLADGYENKSSVFAEEGTLGHELGAMHIIAGTSNTSLESEYKKLKAHPLYTESLDEHAQAYAAFVLETYVAEKDSFPKAALIVEEKIDFSPWVPEGFGSCDAAIIGETTLHVIDLKMGKGVEVYADNNPQLMLYALGFIHTRNLYNRGITEVKLSIFQPRIGNYSDWSISYDELMLWAEMTLQPTAELAFNGSGEAKAGEHCRFCNALGSCKTVAEYHLDLAKAEFEDVPKLTPEELGDILAKLETLESWSKAVKSHALDTMLSGKDVPGYKAVAGVTRRSIPKESEEEVFSTLDLYGYSEHDYIKRSLVGLGELEKLVGKKMLPTILGDLIVRPEPQPTIAKATDKRPPYDELAIAKADWAD